MSCRGRNDRPRAVSRVELPRNDPPVDPPVDPTVDPPVDPPVDPRIVPRNLDFSNSSTWSNGTPSFASDASD